MNKIIIWHNTRCRKSREGLAMAEKIRQERNIAIEIRKYLDNPPSVEELKNVLKMLEIKPIDLVRVKEAIWKENFKGKDLTDAQIIEAMAKFPKLIERPVVIYKNKAVLGRPAENVEKLF